MIFETAFHFSCPEKQTDIHPDLAACLLPLYTISLGNPSEKRHHQHSQQGGLNGWRHCNDRNTPFFRTVLSYFQDRQNLCDIRPLPEQQILTTPQPSHIKAWEIANFSFARPASPNTGSAIHWKPVFKRFYQRDKPLYLQHKYRH